LVFGVRSVQGSKNRALTLVLHAREGAQLSIIYKSNTAVEETREFYLLATKQLCGGSLLGSHVHVAIHSSEESTHVTVVLLPEDKGMSYQAN